MISFAIGELNCPSLDYVYRMTWAEFCLRSFAYKRTQIEEWKKVRKVAYTALVAPYQNYKKLPTREEKWMPLGDDTKVRYLSDSAKDKFLEATRKYLNNRKHG